MYATSMPVCAAAATRVDTLARLRVVKVGDGELDDVDALVLPDAALHDNLLGLSFLSRITRMCSPTTP
jgi:aspartyl protease family protein